jgi:prepilin-type processing-associated H-X9-DG protein
MRRRRPAYTLFQLLILLAFLLLLAGALLPAVLKVRLAAARMQSQNNLKQIGLACHNYHDTYGRLPVGVGGKNFSGLVYLLPYIEQDNVFKNTDLTTSPDDKGNAGTRALRLKVFESPLDPAEPPDPKAGPTSYLLVAGSKHDLDGNDGVFYKDSAIRLTDITDGTTNTLMALETLWGDGGTKPVSVARQHVGLKKEALKGLADTAGVKEFKAGKHVVGNRGSSWMDGRFLQSTINLTRSFNDDKPDVDCGGEGGLAGPRSLHAEGTNVLMGDGSVRMASSRTKLETWQALATRAGGEVIPADF